MKKQNNEKDIEYLDKEFPKGETKFRGQAMVLLALARREGEQKAIKEVEEKFDAYFTKWTNKWVTKRVTARTIAELKGFKQEINKNGKCIN